ncbi:hypothetical protein V2J09_010032 [Rumex salicifolius]
MDGSFVNKKNKDDEKEEGIGQGQLYSPQYSHNLPITNPNKPKSPKMADDAEKESRGRQEKKKDDGDCNSSKVKREQERRKTTDASPKSSKL